MERSLHAGVPSQSLHPILCMAQRGDNFSFEHMENEKRKGKRNAGGSAENLATWSMNQAWSHQTTATEAHQASCGAAWVITVEGGAQLGCASSPAIPLLTAAGLCPPEVQNITDKTRMYSLFIGC